MILGRAGASSPGAGRQRPSLDPARRHGADRLHASPQLAHHRQRADASVPRTVARRADLSRVSCDARWV